MNEKAQQNFGQFPSYKGGHTTIYNGYIYELCPDNPRSNMWGFAPQHVLVAEDTIGRSLLPNEHVHHIDEQRLNNSPDNLRVMTRSEHRSLHSKNRYKYDLTEDQVRDALKMEGGIKPAARALGYSHSALRMRFPDACLPYRRVTPTKIDDPRDIETILRYASDPSVSLKMASESLHMASMTISRICSRRGVKWVRKSKKGEIHKTYCKKPTRKSLELDGQRSEPD